MLFLETPSGDKREQAWLIALCVVSRILQAATASHILEYDVIMSRINYMSDRFCRTGIEILFCGEVKSRTPNADDVHVALYIPIYNI